MKSKLLDLLVQRSATMGSPKKRQINPPRLLLESFLVLIGLGACLLKLPLATEAPISWLEAAFTATSAVTVTGLAVVDTGSEFTLFGQVVNFNPDSARRIGFDDVCRINRIGAWVPHAPKPSSGGERSL